MCSSARLAGLRPRCPQAPQSPLRTSDDRTGEAASKQQLPLFASGVFGFYTEGSGILSVGGENRSASVPVERGGSMRRFVTLAVLLLFTIPFGVSISGCSKGTSVVFCNGGDAGPIVGQASTITLLPKIYGISLNQGQIGQVSTPTATDCKGSNVT